MYKDKVLPYYEIVQKGDVTVEYNLFAMANLFLGLVGVCRD